MHTTEGVEGAMIFASFAEPDSRPALRRLDIRPHPLAPSPTGAGSRVDRTSDPAPGPEGPGYYYEARCAG